MEVGDETQVTHFFFARNYMKCADLQRKVMFPNLHPIGVGNDSKIPIFLAGNCMKYPDLHRKVMFSSTYSMGWGQFLKHFLSGVECNMQICTESHMCQPLYPRGWVKGSQVPKLFWDGNCMKCTDLNRKVIIPILHSHLLGMRIKCRKNPFWWELHEVCRFVQKCNFPSPTTMGWQWGWIDKSLFLLGIKCSVQICKKSHVSKPPSPGCRVRVKFKQ